MRKSVYLLLFLAAAGVTAQKNIYQSEKFEELSKTHHTLAILPFLTTLHLPDASRFSEEQIRELSKKEGYAIQEALETYFLKKKKRKDFTVSFQDIQNTNAILAKHQITIENIDIYTTQELCALLEVDGLISGNITLSKLLSKGISDDEFSLLSIFTGKTHFGRIAIKISDGKTGKLLWKYEKTIDRKSGKNTRAVIEGMMRQSSRNFPYERERKNQ